MESAMQFLRLSVCLALTAAAPAAAHSRVSVNLGFGRGSRGGHFQGGFARSAFRHTGFGHRGFGHGGFRHGGFGYGGFGGFYLAAPLYLAGGYIPTIYSYPYYAPTTFGGGYLSPYAGFNGPTVQRERFVYIERAAPPAPAPQDRYEAEPLPRDRDFYLERRDPPAGILEVVRRELRVDAAEPGSYLVRWARPEAQIAKMELQSLDAAGHVLHGRFFEKAPFRGLLDVPKAPTVVTVTLSYRSGASASVKLPVAEFRAIERQPR
jgi:hypothetical protein